MDVAAEQRKREGEAAVGLEHLSCRCRSLVCFGCCHSDVPVGHIRVLDLHTVAHHGHLMKAYVHVSAVVRHGAI